MIGLAYDTFIYVNHHLVSEGREEFQSSGLSEQAAPLRVHRVTDPIQPSILQAHLLLQDPLSLRAAHLYASHLEDMPSYDLGRERPRA
jgi:hypothetical protein